MAQVMPERLELRRETGEREGLVRVRVTVRVRVRARVRVRVRARVRVPLLRQALGVHRKP